MVYMSSIGGLIQHGGLILDSLVHHRRFHPALADSSWTALYIIGSFILHWRLVALSWMNLSSIGRIVQHGGLILDGLVKHWRFTSWETIRKSLFISKSGSGAIGGGTILLDPDVIACDSANCVSSDDVEAGSGSGPESGISVKAGCDPVTRPFLTGGGERFSLSRLSKAPESMFVLI